MLRLVFTAGIAFGVAITGHAAPFLEGQVTDDQGRPLAGATVKIFDCIGTCLGGGDAVLTNEEGRYSFEAIKSRNPSLLNVIMPGRYEVSRRITGPGLAEAEADIPRRADFVLGTPAAAVVNLRGEVPKGWIQTVVVRSGRDAAVHRYDFAPQSSSDSSFLFFQELPRNENLHLVVVRRPSAEPSDDPKIARERLLESRRAEVEILSPPFRLSDPQQYSLRAGIEMEQDSATKCVRFESITDGIGAERIRQSQVDDPLFGPPVSSEKREQAELLLRRVQEATPPWLGTPLKMVASYEYDATDSKGNVTHVQIDRNSPQGPAWSDISRLRGFAYMPPLRWIFSQPENLEFHGVELGVERCVLTYRLKAHRGFGAGLGVGPHWNGFFTTGFSAGKIVIDPRTATVTEHHLFNGLLGRESIETFANYVPVNAGLAPQSIRIQSGEQDFRLSFRIYHNRLWLAETGALGEQPPVLKIENVVVKLD